MHKKTWDWLFVVHVILAAIALLCFVLPIAVPWVISMEPPSFWQSARTYAVYFSILILLFFDVPIAVLAFVIRIKGKLSEKLALPTTLLSVFNLLVGLVLILLCSFGLLVLFR